jgi:IclR family acetate operon transcriptional repressor
MAAEDDRQEHRSGTQTVERAIAILETFQGAKPSLGITEIARTVGLNVSTTHRLVKALVNAGYMEQETTSERYRLGLGIAVIGQRALEHSGYHLAKPILNSLVEATGESCSIGIRRDQQVVVIERTVSVQPLRFDHPAGAEILLHASGMGKTLLAFGPATPKDAIAGLRGLPRYTTRTITTRVALLTELEAVRKRGYATNVEERYDGVSGIAAPILDADGVAHAAIGVQGPSLRLTAARLKELAPLIRRAAAEIAVRTTNL